jgi:hypothetical protein
MYDYAHLIQTCREREQEEVKTGFELGTEVFSRLSKKMERDFLPKFQEMAWQFSKKLKPVTTIAEFDTYHHNFVVAVRNDMRSRSGTMLSYGEAQKPVNVFLKEYLEKSAILDAATIKRLSPYLHVTMDGVIILYLQSFFREDYLHYVAPANEGCGHIYTEKLLSFHKKDISESHLTQLMFFNREVYTAWQGWFRRICPNRPVLLDAVWSIARRTLLN